MARSASVLFIGYDDLLLKLRGQALRAAGFRVVYAQDEPAALRRARGSHVDLILVCHTVPFEDRQRIERDLKSIRYNVPIVVLFTGLDYPDIFADLFIHAFAGSAALVKGVTAALANSMSAAMFACQVA